MKNKLRYYYLTLSSGLLIFLNVAVVSSESSRPPIRIGAVLALTGPAAAHGTAIRNGMQLAADELRQSGQPIEITLEDDQSDAKVTASKFQQLLSRDIQLFLGPTWSYQARAAGPVLNRNQAIAVVPGGSSDINGGIFSGIINLGPKRSLQKPLVTDWLTKTPFTHAMTITPNGEWGEVHLAVFSDGLRAINKPSVGAEVFDYGADVPALKPLALRAKAKGVDLIMCTGSGSDVANIIRAARETGYTGKFLSASGVHDAVDNNLIPHTALEGIFALDLKQLSNDFESKYTAKFGDQAPKYYADKGYDALRALVLAVQATDGSPKAVKEYALKSLDFIGVSGRIAFDADGDLKEPQFEITPASRFVKR